MPVSLALTRDNKEVINVQTDGAAQESPASSRPTSNYSFDATETEPPNTNSFFGPAVTRMASDTTTRKVRGCIHHLLRPPAPTSPKCLDMAFQ